MNYIVLYVYFVLFTGTITYIVKKDFGKCLPLAFFASSIVLFISQFLFSTFKVGIFFNLMFALAFPILLIIAKFKKKDLAIIKEIFLSKGLIAFTVIFIMIGLLDINRVFTQWDEFSHWGIMIKEMLRLDSFYSVDASTLMVHKDYPPIVQIYEAFCCYISGGYSEALIIKSMHLISFSLFIPAISEQIKNNKFLSTVIKTVLFTCIIYIVFSIMDSHSIINSIYLDYLLSITAAYCLFIIISSKDTTTTFNLISLGLGLSFLVLIKQMGLALYCMIIFMFLFDLILKSKNNIKLKIDCKIIIKIFLIIVIVPLVIWKMWGTSTSKIDNLEVQFDTADLQIKELPQIIIGTAGESWQHEASKNYISAVLNNKLINYPINLTYWQLVILIAFIIYILGNKYKKYFYKHQIESIILTFILGAIGYAFAMLILYVFSFGPIEGPSLASFGRYMPTYILIGISIIFMILIMISSRSNKFGNILIILIIITLLTNSNTITSKLPPVSKNIGSFESMANYIVSKTKEDSSIFIIAEASDVNYQYFIKYYMHPRTTTLINYNFSKELDTEMKKYISSFDYIYLAQFGANFVIEYGYLFDKIDDIEINSLYTIIYEADELTFIKVS